MVSMVLFAVVTTVASGQAHDEFQKAAVSETASESFSPPDFFKAIATGDLTQVKAILAETPELVNAKNEKTGLTAVELAFMSELQRKKLEIAPYLIEKGAAFEVNKIGRSGYSTLDLAIVFGYAEAVDYLIKLGAEINSIRQRDGKAPLINAITRNREKIASLLIDKGADANRPDREGRPPLYHAVRIGLSEVVRRLLAKGAGADFVDDSGRSLLQIASLNGYYGLVEILLGKSPEINALDKAGRSALDYASKYGQRRIANLLAAHGALPSKGLEKNFGKSRYLTEKIGKGDAAVWYLNNRGWAVKTRNHLLVFDSEEFGVRRPDEPLLANGFLSPYEVADQNIVALYTAYHGETGEPAYIHTIEDSVSSIRYIHNKLDSWRGSEKTIYMATRDEKWIGALRVVAVAIQEKMPVLGYMCRVDDVTVFYSGFRPEDFEKYKAEIDFLAQKVGKIDLAFFPVAEKGEENPELMYLLDKLQPQAVFPLDPDRREYLFAEMKDRVLEKQKHVKVFCAENPGDHFYFRATHGN